MLLIMLRLSLAFWAKCASMLHTVAWKITTHYSSDGALSVTTREGARFTN